MTYCKEFRDIGFYFAYVLSRKPAVLLQSVMFFKSVFEHIRFKVYKINPRNLLWLRGMMIR